MKETVEQLKTRTAELRRLPHLTNERIDAVNEAARQLRYADVSLATELSAEALQLAARNGYERGRAFALLSTGWCQMFTDQYGKAEQNFEKSRTLFLRLRDDAGLASAMNGLAISKERLGSYEAALESYQAALELREKLGDTAGAAGVLVNFGSIHFYLSDYAQSLDYYYQALQKAIDRGSFNIQANTYSCLGNVLWRVDDAPEALQCAGQALVLYRKHPDRRGESTTLNNIGAAYHSRGDHKEALGSYERALALAQATGNLETQAEAKLGIGSISCEASETEQALVHLSEALQLSQQIGSRFYESQALLQLGAAQRQAGEQKASVQLFERALEISERPGSKEIRYKAHLMLSQAYEAQNKLRAALHHHQSFYRIWQEVHGAQSMRRVQQLLLQHRFGQTPDDKQFLPHPATDNNIINASDKSGELSERKLRKVIEFVNHHLEEKIAVSDLAALANFSPRRFQDLFKQTTGKTPHQFLVEERVKRAKYLLQTTNLPLVEIAARCGFSSQSHLTSQFRLATGTSPRKLSRLQNETHSF